MDEKELLEAAVDYINENTAMLHKSGEGDPPKKQNLGGDITVDDVLTHAIRADEFHLVVDRGILGCPKYRLALDVLQVEEKPEVARSAKAKTGEKKDNEAGANAKKK